MTLCKENKDVKKNDSSKNYDLDWNSLTKKWTSQLVDAGGVICSNSKILRKNKTMP